MVEQVGREVGCPMKRHICKGRGRKGIYKMMEFLSSCCRGLSFLFLRYMYVLSIRGKLGEGDRWMDGWGRAKGEETVRRVSRS